MTARPRLVGLVVMGLLFAGCSDAEPSTESSTPSASPTASDESPEPADRPAYDPALDVALSEPVEDRVYPEVGDPSVDALHYDLDLTWDPDRSALAGTEALTFRSTADDRAFQLDLAPDLDVVTVTLDGERVDFQHRDKDLVVSADVAADQRYVVEIRYRGTPRPVASPTTRSDAALVGWTTMSNGATWTMQEPFGAYTWYAVNDQPSDKALYDFTLRVPDPMVGIANGELTSRATEDRLEVTRWHLAEPAASYLVTVAFDDYVTAEDTTAGGVPVSVWMPRRLEANTDAMLQAGIESTEWGEDRLGSYPFDSLGFLFVDSTSGMETQTMVTLGLTDYTTSMPVLIHEVVHQWWGNQVTPRDWRDLWMSEGMTMYLQVLWESENGGVPLTQRLAEWAGEGQALRRQAGAPAAYDQEKFAETNVYFLPAVMWHDVRTRIGDDTFFRLLRAWPASHDNQSAGYDDITAWWSEESGTDLAGVFRRHLLAKRQPAFTP